MEPLRDGCVTVRRDSKPGVGYRSRFRDLEVLGGLRRDSSLLPRVAMVMCLPRWFREFREAPMRVREPGGQWARRSMPSPPLVVGA